MKDEDDEEVSGYSGYYNENVCSISIDEVFDRDMGDWQCRGRKSVV